MSDSSNEPEKESVFSTGIVALKYARYCLTSNINHMNDVYWMHIAIGTSWDDL